MTLRPFFSFYGAKWRIAPKYPAPRHDIIIEPFAGSAGYSLHYPNCSVILYEADPVIAGIWDYLIQVQEKEILKLPATLRHIDELRRYPAGARDLVGMWINKACDRPKNTPSAWMRSGIRPNSFWGPAIRARVASQLQYIRHWTIINESYEQCPDFEATWFIDPPYSNAAGRRYKYNCIDYDFLGNWSCSRPGQIIVCESEGATWLPFIPFCRARVMEGKHGKRYHNEVYFYI